MKDPYQKSQKQAMSEVVCLRHLVSHSARRRLSKLNWISFETSHQVLGWDFHIEIRGSRQFPRSKKHEGATTAFPDSSDSFAGIGDIPLVDDGFLLVDCTYPVCVIINLVSVPPGRMRFCC